MRLLSLRRSVRAQLIATNVLALALLLTVLGVVVRYTVFTTIRAAIDRDLAERTRPGGRMPGPPPPPGGGPGEPFPRGPGGQFGPEMRPAAGGPDGPGPGWQGDRRPGPWGPFGGFHGGGPPRPLYGPRWFDPAGHAKGHGGEAAFDDAALATARQTRQTLYTNVTDEEGVPLRVYTRPMPDGGAGQVAYPLTEAYAALDGLNRALLLLIPVALLGAGVLGAALTDRVLRRVRAMTQAAAGIGARDLSERLPAAGDDEFSDLATTFNGMLGRLEQAFTRQERLMEQQRRFTADASHELKTPLTVIKGNTSMLLGGRPGEATYRETVGEIDRAADTMGRLVQDLLLLARSDEGRLGRDRIELLAREVLERAATRVGRRDGTATIRIAVEGEPTLRGVEEELTRLVTNLLDNALRHTPPEGTVTLGARRQGSRVVLTVADTGSGIAPEHLPHLGERFYRADAARARTDGGTGLGLAICRAIAEAHGGALAIQSAAGRGTTVTITLPAADKPGIQHPAPESRL